MLKKELWINKYAPKLLNDIVYQHNVIHLLKKTYRHIVNITTHNTTNT